MKFACLLLALALSLPTFAQNDLPRGEEVVLSSDELKSLVRKMAELRAQRYALYQQRYQQWQQYYASLATQQNKGEAAGAGLRSIEKTSAPAVDRTVDIEINDDAGAYVVDTFITIDPLTFAEDTTISIRRTEQATDQAELDALRRRLDRQEELLLQIRDANMPRAKAAPQRDTLIERIMTTDDPNRLSREDLRRLTLEMEDMNNEIGRLRSSLVVEENRRRRAEDRMEDAFRDDRFRDRDLRFGRGFNQPNVIVDRSPTRPGVIRDTVFVDRTTEVLRTDTVMRASEPTVIRDTVVEDRIVRDEVVRVETVELAAKEPIGFPTVFFDNNSATLNTNHRNILAGMIDDMQNKGGYTVRLTGYASRSGNAEYNQRLSARRAEAVRQGLTSLGVPESRIRLVAGGIDFQATTPAAGRRVEILAIPQ